MINVAVNHFKKAFMFMKRFVYLLFSAGLSLYGQWADAEEVKPLLPQLPLSASQVKRLEQLLHVKSSHYTLASHTPETPAEHVVWNRTPIAVYLPIGVERMIHFPMTVQVGYDKTVLTDAHIRVQNNQGTLYLLAKQAFTAERIQIKLDNGKIILLDLSAKPSASHTPLAIVMPDDKPSLPLTDKTEWSQQSLITSEEKHSEVTSSVMTPIQLTRFAAQQLYAPQRLLTESNAIYRVPMHTKKTVDLVCDGSVMAMPLASWRGGDQFVTAILLRNNLPHALILHPQDLSGEWQTATFFPQCELAQRGTAIDSTTVFLVSQRSFVESLNAR